jgi:hypothetical protein
LPMASIMASHCFGQARCPESGPFCYRPHITKPIEPRLGDGPWTVVLWRDRQPAIISGLDRYPIVGDRFVVNGELWRVVDARESYICEREQS